MDDAYFVNALRYLAFDPVRAGLAATPEWPWSSVRAHLVLEEDPLAPVAALRHMMRQAGNDDAGDAGHWRRVTQICFSVKTVVSVRQES